MIKQQYKKARKQGRQVEEKVKKEEVRKPKGSQELPSLQKMLAIPQAERSSQAYDYFKQMKPFIQNYAQKKEGSRVIQLIYKWGNQEIKSSIFQIVEKHWKEICHSKYALFLVEKVLKDFDIPIIFQDPLPLLHIKEGSHLLQEYMSKNPESPHTKELKNSIANLQRKAKEGDMKSQQILHNMALKSIQKQYYNHILTKQIIRLSISSMFDEEKQRVIEFLVEHITELVGDEEGVRLFCEVLNHCDNKQKKAVIKLYKGNVSDALSNSHLAYVSVIKLLTEVDDTVIISRTLVPELEDLIPTLHENKKLYNVLISLLTPRHNALNCLGKYEREVPFTLCKKPENERQKQVRSYLYDSLLQYFTSPENLPNCCKDSHLSKMALAIIKAMQEDGNKARKGMIEAICQCFHTDLKEKLGKRGKKNIEQSLMGSVFGSKLIKNILGIQEAYIDPYCDKFVELMNKNLELVLKSKVSFVLTVLIEKGGRDWLLEEIKALKINMKEVVAGRFYEELMQKL